MTSVRQRLREALGSGAFRRYLLVRAASQVGDGLFQQAAAAVLLFEEASANPALDLLRVTAIIIIPFTIIAPFSGVAIDRFERRSILTWTPIARAALAGVIAFTVVADREFWFLMTVLVVLSLNRFFLATLATVLPQLVPREDLVVANSASSTSGAVASVTGQAVGSLSAEFLGGRATSALSTVGFVASSRLARTLPVHRGLDEAPAPLRQEVARVVREMRDGFRRMQQRPRVRRGMLAIALLQFLVGVLVAILLHFLVAELGLGPSSGFAMLAVLAVGVGAGVVLVPWISERLGLPATIRIAFLIGGAGTLLPIGSLNRGLMSISAGLVGVAYALVKVPVDTIVQEDIDDETRGRAFSVYDMLFNGARIAGTAVSAIVYELGIGTRAQMTVTTIGFAAVATALRVPARVHYEPAPAAESLVLESATMPSQPPFAPVELPATGTLVRVVAEAGGRPEEEPAALAIDDRRIPVALLWRGRVASLGRERRVLGVAGGSFAVRLVHDPSSGSWEVTAAWPVGAAGPRES